MTTIVDSLGRIVSKVSGDAEAIRLNTPNGCVAVDDPPEDGMYYSGGSWHKIPDTPGSGYSFDYATRQWLDVRSIDDVRVQRWNTVKRQRDQLEFGGFEYAGNIYDSDQVSQGRIMGAALAGVDQVWTTADNSTVSLTGAELLELYQALQAHIASVHERGRIARLAVERAITKEEVESITL